MNNFKTTVLFPTHVALNFCLCICLANCEDRSSLSLNNNENDIGMTQFRPISFSRERSDSNQPLWEEFKKYYHINIISPLLIRRHEGEEILWELIIYPSVGLTMYNVKKFPRWDELVKAVLKDEGFRQLLVDQWHKGPKRFEVEYIPLFFVEAFDQSKLSKIKYDLSAGDWTTYEHYVKSSKFLSAK
jgi:hypothetical protein